MNRFLVKNKSGFSLVELLTTIALLAILATMILPHFRRALAKAQLTDCMNSQRVIATMIQTYYLEYKGFPEPDTGAGSDLIVPFSKLTPYYTNAEPKTYCPTINEPFNYMLSPDLKDDFTIYCYLTDGGSSHPKVGIPEGYPQYSFSTGLLDGTNTQ